LLRRLGDLQAELVALAQRLATAESRAGAAEGVLKAVREERDTERARAAELVSQAAQADALRTVLDVERRRGDELHRERDRLFNQLIEERRERDRTLERHAAELGTLHERTARAEHDRDQALERLEQTQAAHVDELFALREQMAVVAHDRDRAAEALAAHLALPWWRRLFG
jgi:hypothetical protein